MIVATEWPTVPKPTSAIFRRRSADADFRAARDFAVFDLDAARDLTNEIASG
jgi:hypothetical protein